MRRPSRFGILNLGVWIILATMLVATSACSGTPEVKPPASPSPAATASPGASPSPMANVAAGKADALVGRWAGVEGTYLDITKKGDNYSVEIANLDGAKTYDGKAKDDVIEFTRNGKAETIKTATGSDTGMKGFEKETNCVVVTKGSEGFCKK
ncbi:MAG: hypothetical protein ABI857_12440 [Acidobacteriota bacterium]